jgi:chorismate mutase
VSEQSSDPIVEQYRNQITDTDLAILEALNKRLSLVQKLHDYKAQKGYEMTDVSREDWLTQYLQRCNRGPLSQDELVELWKTIIETTKREASRLRDAG